MADAVYTPGPLNPTLDLSAKVVGVDVLTGNTIRFRFPNGESYTVTLPDGAPGFPGTNGVTPTLIVGKVAGLPPGAQPSVAVRSTDTPSRYALDFSLPAGRSIASAAIESVNKHLIISLSDGSTVDAGQVAGPPGIGLKSSVITNGRLIFTFADDTTSDVGQVVGATGEEGPRGLTGPAPQLVTGAIASGSLAATVTPTPNPGEYAINLTLPQTPGTGNVNGPSSSVNGDIPLFDGTTGKLLKDSNVKFGIGANNAVQLDSDAALPPVSGAKLIGLEYLAVPAGMTAAFAGATAPTGWLKCNGALVSRTGYAALFAAIGTTFGIGDGSTNFKLPDLRGEFVRGLDDGRGVDAGRALGSAQGDLFKAHTHSETGFAPSGSAPLGSAGSTGSSTGGNTGSTGGTETRPRNVALLYCIKF